MHVRLTGLVDVFGGSDFVVQYGNGDRTSYVMTVFDARVDSGVLRADGKGRRSLTLDKRNDRAKLSFVTGTSTQTPAGRPRKGEVTRQSILEKAMSLASQVGLDGVTIGRLADELGLSKSGLFAHFRSKEALQEQVLQFASERFVEAVIRPALTARRGEPRVRALFDCWLDWARAGLARSGCVFVAAATELDDQPGPVRDRLVRLQKDFLEFIAQAYRVAQAEGHFVGGEAEQFAHDLYGIKLAYHHAARLLRDPRAEERARAAFEALVTAARAGPRGRRGSTAGRGRRRPIKEKSRG